MTTWPDIQKHLRGSYKLADDTPDMISMIWSYDDGRKQKILVRRFKAAEREMLACSSLMWTLDEITNDLEGVKPRIQVHRSR